MNSEEAFAIWAPAESPWSPWVKPILFASQHDWDGTQLPELPDVEPSWLASPEVEGEGYRGAARTEKTRGIDTAYVIDLPGPRGVAWGIALARRGWRPVPLYNAIPGGVSTPPPPPPPQPGVPFDPLAQPGLPLFDRSSLVDVDAIVVAMRRATVLLPKVALAPDRPPAFLLDASRRIGRGDPLPGRFDNRSVSLPTDFPSAVLLRSQKIERVIVLQDNSTEPQADLSHTLLAWQEGGLTILAKALDQPEAPAPITVKRPEMFRNLWQRMLATTGLVRSPLGGFGGSIPLPSSG